MADRFPVKFWVNGVPFSLPPEARGEITVREILLMAGAKSAISTNKMNEYQLVRSDNPHEKWENQGDFVPITDGTSFVALQNGETTVSEEDECSPLPLS